MMKNILSYLGMSLQSEVCLWTLLGLLRTIFDATLFKVNANLKQVWQIKMPEELSMPVQRVLRTMISGVMLVQCFTVYVYLASYIVLLYPVFLEERPTLVLPWLLLAAIRKLLCELTSLALGLGTCVLLGPARPPCIRFVINKIVSIMPAFYMWMLVFSYYHTLKVTSAFKTFPAVLESSDHDYGVELAIRRRRTKSLYGEQQLRKNFYGQRQSLTNGELLKNDPYVNRQLSSRMVHSTDTSIEDTNVECDILRPLSITSNRVMSDVGTYEDWFGSEVVVPRDTDRILEQFGLMLLRIGAYLKKEGVNSSKLFDSPSPFKIHKSDIGCANLPPEDTDTPLLVGNSEGKTASYLREYPQIFMKKVSDRPLKLQSEYNFNSAKTTVQNQNKDDDNPNIIKTRNRTISVTPGETVSLEIEKIISRKKINASKLDKKYFKKKLNNRQVSQDKSKYVTKNRAFHHEDKTYNILENEKTAVDNNNLALSSTDSLNSIINTFKNLPKTNKSSKVDQQEIDKESLCHPIYQGEVDSSSRASLENVVDNTFQTTSVRRSKETLNKDT